MSLNRLRLQFRRLLLPLLAVLSLAVPAGSGAHTPDESWQGEPEPFPFSDRYPAQVTLERQSEWELLQRSGVDIGGVKSSDSEGREGPPWLVTVYINLDEQARLEGQGLAVRTVPNVSLRAFREYGPGTKGPDAWPTFSEYVARMQAIAAGYPNIVRVFSIGQSVQGRPIWVLKITDNPDAEEDEPELKYSSTVHGTEAVGTELTLRLAELLTNNYGIDSDLTRLVNETEVWLIPIHNPDGYVLGTRYNAHGIDLNRNFPDRITDPVDDPVGREPETVAFMNLGYAQRFVMGANFHTGARVVNYPWDSVVVAMPDYAPDDATYHEYSVGYALRNPMIYSGGFPEGVTRGWEWYVIRGGMQDWAYHWQGEHHVTIELSDQQPPPYSLMDSYWDANRDAMIWWFGRGLTGARGLVTDAVTGLALDAVVEVQEIGIPLRTDAAVGDYHWLLLPGQHTLRARAQGYLDQSAMIAVGTGDATRFDFALSPAPTWSIEGRVIEAGTNQPLVASIEFLGTSVFTSSQPLTGRYAVRLAQGKYVMRVSSAGHLPQERSIVVDQDQVQDFALDRSPCTLLVDDDLGESYQTYFQASLAALGSDYDLWTVSAAGSPTAADLKAYGRVIWFTGNDSSTTLTTSDQSQLASYLNAGGRLFLTGQDIGYNIRTSPFYADYLHATYVRDDTNDLTLTGVDLMTGIDLSIYGGDGADNQNYPSQINPANGSIAVWEYSPAVYGGVAFPATAGPDDIYRVVYLAFGFEAIENATDRTEVLSRTLAWLGNCPVANPDAAGVDLQVMGSASQTALAGETATYQLQVTNTGVLTDRFAVTLSGSSWPSTAQPTQTAVLDGLETATLEVAVTVPESPAVEDVVTVRVTSNRDPTAIAERVLRTRRAFFAVATGRSQQTGLPGTTVTHTVRISNTGTLTDSYALALEPGAWPAAISGSHLGPLAGGSAGWAQVAVALPPQPPGRRIVAADRFTLTINSVTSPTIGAVVVGTSLAEASLGANLTADRLLQVAVPGETALYHLQITNLGNCADRYLLSVHSADWPSVLDLSQTPMLEPGESTFFDLQVTVPPGPPAGIGTTIVSAQSGWDADYQAQLATTTVRSDPAVGLGESVAAGAPGSLVTHTLVITNHGNLTDSYSLSTQPGLWNCQVTVGSTGVLSPAQSEPVQLQVAIPHQMAGRTVIASDQCLLTATSQLSSSITGIGIAWTHAVVAPGLVLTSASDQLTGMPGGTLTYTLAMTNTGTYWDAFELAVDGEFWPTRVSPEETPPVQPGQRYEVAVAVTIPFATNLTSDAATVRAVSGWDAAVWREIPLVTRRLWVTFLPLAVR